MCVAFKVDIGLAAVVQTEAVLHGGAPHDARVPAEGPSFSVELEFVVVEGAAVRENSAFQLCATVIDRCTCGNGERVRDLIRNHRVECDIH